MIRKILGFIALTLLITFAQGKVGHASATIFDPPEYDLIVTSLTRPPKPKPSPEPPKQLTEADNPQHCNLETQWTASEAPFYCIEKSYQDSSSNSTVTHANYTTTTDNTYYAGQCTWGVKEWRPSIPNGLGNAYSWVASAQALGMATGSVPRVNAVGVEDNHVVLVVAVSGTNITIREMNYDWVPYHEHYKEAQASEYYYIY